MVDYSIPICKYPIVNNTSKFYVYVLWDVANNEPFYVGKGSGNRMYQHERDVLNESYTKQRSVHCKIKAMKVKNQDIVYEQIPCTSEQQAFDLEKQLIHTIGRLELGTGPLRNLTEDHTQ